MHIYSVSKVIQLKVDVYNTLQYQIGRDKQECEFFVSPEMNRNIILERLAKAVWCMHAFCFRVLKG